jgi:protoporphyrinogen/coproporphyrinogen III oxidase
VAEDLASVAVVGGGIAGLCAAYELGRRGVPFRLLEAGDRWGGVIRTERTGGFLLEGGPDSILAQKPDGLALCRELDLAAHIVPTNPQVKTVYVLHEGRLHPLPEGMLLGIPTRIAPFLRTRLLSWPAKLRMALEVLVPRRPAPGDESVAAFLQRRLGAEAVSRLGEPLLGGIHAGDPSRLSLTSNFRRLADLERSGRSLIRGLRASAPASPLPSAFFSLQGGLAELVTALLGHIPDARRRTGLAVHSLARHGDGFQLRTSEGPVLARRVILAVPAPAASRLLGELSSRAAEALSTVRFASTAAVCLGYRREQVGHPLDGYGLVATRAPGKRITACTFVSTKFPGRAPDGHVLLRAFAGGIQDPGVLDLGDAELVSLVEREMGPVLALRGAPVVARVYRWPAGTPQMEVGHGVLMAGVEDALRGVPGVFLTGSGLRGTGIPDTIADARATAGRAAA